MRRAATRPYPAALCQISSRGDETWWHAGISMEQYGEARWRMSKVKWCDGAVGVLLWLSSNQIRWVKGSSFRAPLDTPNPRRYPGLITGGESPAYSLCLRALVSVWQQSRGGITAVDSSPSPSIYGEIKKRLLSRDNFSTSLASVSLSLRLRPHLLGGCPPPDPLPPAPPHLLDSQMTRENTAP